MDFHASLDYLHSLGWELRPGRKFDLAHIAALLDALGHPERRFASIHVAGTNGKGSTAAFIEAAAAAAGWRTGLYTSPHLERVTERIRIAGEEIALAAFAAAATQVRAAAETLLAAEALPHPPSFFEAMTAIGFVALADAEVALAVVEVGLGGRLDATNVLAPALAVITPIGFDHEQYLGSSLAAIAAEKAGILKPGISAAVIAPQSAEALGVLRARAAAVAVPLHEVAATAPGAHLPAGDGAYTLTLDYRGAPVVLTLGLRGRHQLDNARTAALACAALDHQGWSIPPQALVAGFAHVRWPGRLELMQANPPIYLDGAHNPQAAAALAVFMDELAQRPAGAPVLVYGSMRDKAIEEICELLFPRARAVVLTAPRQPRALAPAALAAACAALAPHAECVPGIEAALHAALRISQGQVPIIAAGSLYLVGEARALWSSPGTLRP